MKKLLVLLLGLLLLTLAGCGGSSPSEKKPTGNQKRVLNLFSWADNFSPEVLADFEKSISARSIMMSSPIMKNCWPKCRPVMRSTI